MSVDRAFRLMRDAIAYRTLGPTARAVRRERLTYLSAVKLSRIESTLSSVITRETPGDVLEFGVALGGSAIVLAQHAQNAGRRFHGFDVFGMIPAPASDKDDAKSKQRYQVIASGASKGIHGDTYYGYRSNLFDEVSASFTRHRLPVNGGTITLHKGLFEETWPAYDGHTIAFAHLDCDWYAPVKYCLSRVAERIAPGGAIVVDDFYAYGGCRTATDEFLSERDDFTLENGDSAILRAS